MVIWYLVIMLGHGAPQIPMQSEDACKAGLKSAEESRIGYYRFCVSNAGEIYDPSPSY